MLKANIDPQEPANRDAVKKWMHQKSVAFYNALHERVKQLTPPVEIVMAGNEETEDE